MIIHCITNYVAMDLTANALLAIGARPLMSAALPEMEDIAQVADALLINIGTLDDSLLKAALVAGQAMRRQNKPVVFDPVGVQVSSYRLQAALRIIEACQPCIIKGNQQEMEALKPWVNPSPSCVLVTTGETDLISDGTREVKLTGGAHEMTQVTAMGCTAGAVMAAMLTQEEDAVVVATKALRLMKDAGKAAVNNKGLGTFRQLFIDYLSCHA